MVNIHEPGPLEGHVARWPVLAVSGALEVRLAETAHEVESAQRLRYRVFYEEMTATPTADMQAQGRDFDHFDDVCDHLLVVDRERFDDNGQPAVVGCYRLIRDVDAARAGGFYTASEYDLSKLSGLPAGSKLLELGRSCILKEYRSRPMAMQLLWRGVLVYIKRFEIDLMFGCASFAGTDPKAFALPLSYLYHFHLAPAEIRVRARADLFVDMNMMPKDAIDPKEAVRALPPILKGYIRAGAMVGDGTVIDHEFGSVDTFVYFPVSKINDRYRSRFEMKI